MFYTNRAIVCFDILCRLNGDGAGGHIAGHVDVAELARACDHAIFFGIMDVSVAYDPYKLLNIFQIALAGSGRFRGLRAAQNMVLRGGIRRSPFSVAPYQIDFCPILTRHAVVGNVRSRRDANSGVELVHVGAEAIDDDLTAVIALMNGERAVSIHLRVRGVENVIHALQIEAMLEQPAEGPARLVVAMDISARKRAENALRTSEQMLARSQQIAHVGHWMWNLASNRIESSEEMQRIFGISSDLYIGDMESLLAQDIHPADLESVLAQLKEFLEVGMMRESSSVRLT